MKLMRIRNPGGMDPRIRIQIHTKTFWIHNTAETEHADMRSLGRKVEISGGREVEVDRLQVSHDGLVRTRGHVGYGGSQPVKKLLLVLLLLLPGGHKEMSSILADQ
jgi:hypothetical protein